MLLAALGLAPLNMANRIDSLNHVMIVVPQSDHWPGQLVLIADGTQACCAKHEPLCIGRHFKPNPAGREYPNEMSAGKKQDLARYRAHAVHHAISPGRGLGW